MHSTLLDTLACASGTLILTPNRRLSAWLIRDHDQLMAGQGMQAWPGLEALPLDAWLQQLYDTIGVLIAGRDRPLPQLLSTRQAAFIWRQVIEADEDGAVDPDGLVQLAQQARTLLCRWLWQDAQWREADKPESECFARWHQHYLERLRHDNLLDQPGMLQWVCDQGAALRATLPARILFHGFNDPDEPRLLHLMTWLQQGGCSVSFTRNPSLEQRSESLAFAQTGLQFGAAIAWALQQRSTCSRIGIVVPNLQQKRADIRGVCQALWAQQDGANQRHWSDVINITAGQKLTDYSLVSHALLLLRALDGTLQLLEWQLLLASPYFSDNQAVWLQRDRFIQYLREQNLRHLTLDAIITRWKRFAAEDQQTSRWLDGLLPLRGRTGKQPVSVWIEWLQRLLSESAWCAFRTLSSEEFQVRQRFLEAINGLLELETLASRITVADFRQQLAQSLRDVQFQPQTETAPIQIMGALEAAGLQFDALWVCECEAVNWPQALSPNPLLSRRLQRTLNMPGATPEREFQYAANLLQGFRGAAPWVLFSWGRRDGDTEHRLSALLDNVVPADGALTESLRYLSLEQLQYQHRRHLIDVIAADTQAAPVEQQHAKGGSGIIKSQSQCPFKAFAEYRLNIRSRDELTDGIKASDRGALVHRVLEDFWREVKNSAQLQQLLQQESALEAVLGSIIERQIQQLRKEVALEPAALYSLEQQRTLGLIQRWLQQHEASRQPFEVAQIEKRQTLAIGGLELALTVDRIDQLENGKRVIIDYKTSDKDSKAWMGERPDEPQLPLYAMLEPDSTSGIYFGVLHNQKMQFKGVQADDILFDDGTARSLTADPDWQMQMQLWQQTLEQLAQAFRRGDAQVDPMDFKVCQYCHLAPVCRVKEMNDDIG